MNSLDSTKPSTRCINLREAWEELRRVRATIQDYFKDGDDELRESATMAALELAENVLKHGCDSGPGMVTLTVEAGEVLISTKNRVESPERARQVQQRIERIAQKGAREMYVARMLEIMQQPNSSESGLGLLRIAYEGSFQLSCEVLGDRLSIQARRQIDHALSS